MACMYSCSSNIKSMDLLKDVALTSCYFATKQEFLLKNDYSCPTGSMLFLEMNVTSLYDLGRGCG